MPKACGLLFGASPRLRRCASDPTAHNSAATFEGVGPSGDPASAFRTAVGL